ncbi:MAG: 1-acyl-sn-glycerol-3-phosphate acyltransferase [Actinomycetales bacterium]|nr:1-acyl-sn-glycerol-3-phosphate acyltransferase [Actinomycetales bacterium]
MARSQRRGPRTDHAGAAFIFITWVVRLAFPLFGRRRYHGVDNLPVQGPVIVACNHISLLDPPMLGAAVFDNSRVPRFLGKASLFRVPFVGAVLRSAGQIPVERTSVNASAALVPAGKVLDAGGCVVLFPEGTFTHDPDGWPMRGKTGAVRLALLSGAPLIPAAVWGTAHAYPTKTLLPRFNPGRTISSVFAEPLDLSDLQGRAEDPEALREGTRRLMAAITELVAQLRDEPSPGSAGMGA